MDRMRVSGIQVVLKSFLTLRFHSILYQPKNFLSKITVIIYCYLKRFLILLHLNRYDFIFIHREATPVGPPVIEWLIAIIFNKKIIYDFDDAIWLTDKAEESVIEKSFRWRSKVGTICKWSYKVSCGNPFLASYARKFNLNVVINPTTIDTDKVHNPQLFAKKSNPHLTIGWTGSRSTLKYLEELEPVLRKIESKYHDTRFLIIADRPPALKLKNIHFVPWSQKTEIQDLMNIDIGIMPLPLDEWTRGKCGFKALQYMALNIPAIVSPVGINLEIIEHGVEGYLCSTEDEWLFCLEKLLLDENLRLNMGKKGREKVISHYSITSNSANFLSLFEE